MKTFIVLMFHHQFHIWPNSGPVLKLWTKMLSTNQIIGSLKCNILRKTWMMTFINDMQINIKVFYMLILSFWTFVTRHAKSTQNRNFAYLCNISRKAWEMKFISCLQINMKVFYKMIESFFCVLYPGMAKVPKTTNLQYL